jgi:predicted O-methyltransferase YrrM
MVHALTSTEINDYAEAMTTPESAPLAKLNRETQLKVEQPIMLSGHLQGAFLAMMSRMLKPRRILEVGTYTGYSALCLAEGLAADGVLHTIDINEELEEMHQRYWSAGGVQEKIVMHVGQASAIIPTLDEAWDLVFIDADKVNYGYYYDLIIEKVRPGGFIFADNVLYHAEVILPLQEQSRNARAMHAFNEKINADPRVKQLLLPLRDGILMIEKV